MAQIKIADSTRDTLRARKEGAETYDDVIQRLLDGENNE
jgi:predicted CopG family antitoxin